jgi:hypothetical protein
VSFEQYHLERLLPGIEIFNQEKFWECHEELEHMWLEDRGDPARYVYWAVIQVAACLYHVRNENLVGATGMLKKAREKFQYCRDNHVITPLLLNSLNWVDFENEALAIPDSPKLSDFNKMYHFKFITK